MSVFIRGLMSVLTFLRLADENGNLSLTNLAVIIALGKIVSTRNASMVDLSGLLLSLMAYQHKKLMARGDAEDDAQLAEAHEKASTAVSQVESMSGDVAELKEQLTVLNNRTRPVGGMR